MNIRPGFNGQFPQRNNSGPGASNSWQSQNNPSSSETWDSGQNSDMQASFAAQGGQNFWQSQNTQGTPSETWGSGQGSDAKASFAAQRGRNFGQSQNTQGTPSETWGFGQGSDAKASFVAQGGQNFGQSQNTQAASPDQASNSAQAWDISDGDTSALASRGNNKCAHNNTIAGTSDSPSPDTSTTTPDTVDTPTSSGTQQSQMLAGLQQALVTMVSMFTQMMSGLWGNQPASTATTVPPQPSPDIVPTQMDFSNDTELKQRQYELLGGKNSQIDTLINTLNNADPLSAESETIQGQISDLWTQGNGDPNALKEYKALQTVIKENYTLSWLSAVQQNMVPNSVEYIDMGIQIANAQELRQAGITTAQSLETNT